MADAVIAIRVSPRPAENVRYSPEMQEQQCREWCEANGHEVVGVIRDILVSGGSAKRFDSVFDALERYRPVLFVVADLSRWTRDTPTRYYAMRAILEDAGVRLVSVIEPFVGSDMPFSDTITTAVVESNYQQRLIANRKTSAGVRKAWASGKRFGRCFGWTWDPETRGWVVDTDRIRSLYEDWLAGVSLTEMARRHGVYAQTIAQSIRAKRQRDVVGAETWDRAQQVRRPRAVRHDVRHGAVFRGLLKCPFCGWNLNQMAGRWGVYRCSAFYQDDHHWISVSSRQWVVPEVRMVLGSLVMPRIASEAPRSLATARKGRKGIRDHERELERLSQAFIRGRISQERYDSIAAEIEADRDLVRIPDPPEVRTRVLDSLAALLPYIDCTSRRFAPCACPVMCPREPEVAEAINGVLRSIIEHIGIGEDRRATVRLRPEYDDWRRDP